MRSTLGLVVFTSALALVSACKDKPAATPPVTAPAGPAVDPGISMDAAGATAVTPTPPVAGALTDPQIAAIVVAANQVDIDAGNLALKKAKSAAVKAFAQTMITDHSAVNKAAVELVTRLKITPEESDASKALVAGGVANRDALTKLEGAAFDKAYVNNEVAYHKDVIGVLETLLIPSATNAELKTTLVGVKPAFDAHLAHAESIQAQLAGGGAAPGSAHKM